MSVKSNYFKMDKKDFDNYLDKLKSSNNTLHFLDGKYFYTPSSDILNLVLSLNKKIVEFDFLINSFTSFSKRQILQSFLIDEIESTNKIENIISTRHNIFSIISNTSISSDRKIISIANSYKHLLKSKGNKITSVKEIRELYDVILNNAILKKDLPDGKYFRKGNIYVSNGLKILHAGTSGEENIIKEMNEFIKLYNSNIDTITKMILCHFIFENIHPFYDGNGRIGRYLFSNGLFLETQSLFSFLLSSSFEHEKKKYYKAFKEANDRHEFGCLNIYVEIILDILINQINIEISKLNKYKEEIENMKLIPNLSKSEMKVYILIKEASLLSDIGVSNEEIIQETQISKRTLINVLNKLKKEEYLIDTKIGKLSFHRLKNI